MKKFNIYIFIALLLVGVSCEDRLDLLPPQDVDNSVALSTDANVKAVLLGAYDALSNGDLFGGNTLRNSELLGADGEIVFSGTFGDPADIWRKQITNINSDVTETWIEGYEVINICNNVLSALDVVDEADRALVEGEAKFIRGLMYFELVKFFGTPYSAGGANSSLAIPIADTPNSTEEYEKSTVEEVYQLVISDLTFAENNLPSDNGTFANRVAAAAVLSRVFLQQENFAGARDAANRGLNYATGVYSLVGNLAGVYNNTNNTSEDVFAIQVNTQDGVNNMQLFFASPTLGGRGDIEIQPSHFDIYEANDERANLFYNDEATGDIRTAKWTNQFGNVVLVRLAELYLTRAEGNVRLGQSVGDSPANDLNLLRQRAGLADVVSPTLADVLAERNAELAFEGHKIHDIKRLQLSTDGLSYDSDQLIFPVPQREEGVNPNL